MSSFSVLLVDDDEVLASMVSEYLSGYGLTLGWAKDAEEALRKLEQKPFDVVLLDVMLPGLDGFGLLPRPPTGERGVGLGLALVRRIARLHRGDARCLPRPGGGSIFAIDLMGPPS